MRYPKHPQWKKHWRRDRTNVCNGRCPSCRGYKGSTKHEKGFKKKAYRDLQERLANNIYNSQEKNHDPNLFDLSRI